MMTVHLNEDTIHAYILRELNQEAGASAERHLLECESCRSLLASEVQYIAAMRRAMRQ